MGEVGFRVCASLQAYPDELTSTGFISAVIDIQILREITNSVHSTCNPMMGSKDGKGPKVLPLSLARSLPVRACARFLSLISPLSPLPSFDTHAKAPADCDSL